MMDGRAQWSVPLVAAVVALPALAAADIPIAGRVLFADRAAQMAATAALGLWMARRGSWASIAVLAAFAWCFSWVFVPRLGVAWPSYSLPDMALVLSVAWSLLRLQREQTDALLAMTVGLALALWLADGVLMPAYCGALIAWDFGTSGTACGAAWGSAATVPAYLTLAAWVAAWRWQRAA